MSQKKLLNKFCISLEVFEYSRTEGVSSQNWENKGGTKPNPNTQLSLKREAPLMNYSTSFHNEATNKPYKFYLLPHHYSISFINTNAKDGMIQYKIMNIVMPYQNLIIMHSCY